MNQDVHHQDDLNSANQILKLIEVNNDVLTARHHNSLNIKIEISSRLHQLQLIQIKSYKPTPSSCVLSFVCLAWTQQNINHFFWPRQAVI